MPWLFALALLGVGVAHALPLQKQKPSQQDSPKADACRPAVLRDFCRVGCPDSPPVQTHRVEASVKQLWRPLPSGVAILEIGVNVHGEVVSACVVRGVRRDFDEAAQRASLQGRWKWTAGEGRQRGFVLTVTFCTPDQQCTAPDKNDRPLLRPR